MTTAHLTPADLAARWKRSTPWVRALLAAERIPGAIRVGSRWRIPIAAVEEYERRHTVRDPLSMTDLAAARRRRPA